METVNARSVSIGPNIIPDYVYAQGIVTRPVPTMLFQQENILVSAPCFPDSSTSSLNAYYKNPSWFNTFYGNYFYFFFNAKCLCPVSIAE